ncbi:MAG: methylene-tetrahydromethanopterin dehydrogenase N-terminal domain-containing protein, partial [Phycisphaeraceae bacterium]|nr:methylene-tetrahydromethanopterin dehydrogenase N-terminal domain-containing protein [Phycisphaeraceae bacterium]
MNRGDSLRSILIQLDTDPHPSVFDRVVAVDAGVDEVMAYGGVTPDTVETLVHGAIFTRGMDDLHRTAIFVGGSDVSAAEAVMERVQRSFVGPMKVSVMFDGNGSNTTAAAAVLAAGRHVELGEVEALVLAGTGPVG